VLKEQEGRASLVLHTVCEGVELPSQGSCDPFQYQGYAGYTHIICVCV